MKGACGAGIIAAPASGVEARLAPWPGRGVAPVGIAIRSGGLDFRMLKHYGAVVGIVGGVTLLQLANTIFAVVLPLQLALAGYSGTTAGIVVTGLRHGFPRRLRRRAPADPRRRPHPRVRGAGGGLLGDQHDVRDQPPRRALVRAARW